MTEGSHGDVMKSFSLPTCVRLWLIASLVWVAGAARAEQAPASQPSPAEASDRAQVVSMSGDRLTVDVQDVSLPHLLEEVARQSDLVIRGHESLRERVTIRLEGLPIDQSLRLILRNQSYGLVSGDGLHGRETAGRTQRELWIMPPSESRQGGESQGVPELDSEIAELLAIVENSEDSWEKEDAIRDLLKTGQRSVALPMIRQALVDDVQSVKLSAVYALAQLGGDESADALALALDDHDDQVRLQAVEALGSIGGEKATAFLEYAWAGDRSQEVRDTALALLKRPVLPVR